MPCLDAKALETDPEGMAFLRSVLRPDAGATQTVPLLPEPAASSSVVLAPVPAALPAKTRHPRRSAALQPAIG